MALAVSIKAGLTGIEQKMVVPTQHKENLYHMEESVRLEKGIHTLPGSLAEAVNEMRTSKLVQGVLGEHAYEHYLLGKSSEIDEFRLHVSDLEVKKYLNQ